MSFISKLFLDNNRAATIKYYLVQSFVLCGKFLKNSWSWFSNSLFKKPSPSIDFNDNDLFAEQMFLKTHLGYKKKQWLRK